MLKKLSVMIVTVLAASLLLTATVSAGETMYVVNVADSVYLRNAPASSDYYTTVPLGAAVESVGWQRGWDGDGYNQVYYQGMSGWIKSIYLGYTSGGSVGGDVLYVSNVDAAVYLRNAPASSDYYTTVPLYAAVIGIGWQRGWDGSGACQNHNADPGGDQQFFVHGLLPFWVMIGAARFCPVLSCHGAPVFIIAESALIFIYYF